MIDTRLVAAAVLLAAGMLVVGYGALCALSPTVGERRYQSPFLLAPLGFALLLAGAKLIER